MIKKFTLLLVMLLGITGVNAKTAQKSLLWEGSNVDDKEIVIEKEKFSSVESGDIICIFFTFSTGGSLHVGYRTGSEAQTWDYTAFNGISEWPSFSNNNTQYAEYAINANDAATLKDYGLRIKGFASSIITKVSLLENSSETATSTSSIFSGSQTLAQWGNLELKGDDEKAILANSKIGDVIRVTIKNASSTSIALKNSSWTELVTANVEGKTEDQYVNFQIRTAGHLDQIRNGIILTAGGDLTITAVDLLTYASSYDAVSITVGSDGVATYSNGGKDVQISACGALKAYYASAVTTGSVTLTELTGCIPANTGVMVYGAGTHTVPIGSEGSPGDVTNYLKPTGDNSQDVARSVEGTYHYIFAKHGSDIGFYLLDTSYEEGGKTYHTLAAHKAYLETATNFSPDPSTPAPALKLIFGGEGEGTTAINTVSKNPVVEDGVYYNLQGVAVKNPSKGLYILNGKKVIVK